MDGRGSVWALLIGSLTLKEERCGKIRKQSAGPVALSLNFTVVLCFLPLLAVVLPGG